MARPRKNNADYFSHDNDMRNDDKILSVRRKFGHEGYSVRNMLLEKLCKSTGFIIDVDNVSIELLSGDFVVDPDKLKEIIDYFVYIRLIYRDGDRIYSQKMIDRFEGLLSKRQRDIEYRQGKQKNEVVIDVEKPQSKVKEIKVKQTNNNILSEQDIKDKIQEIYGLDIIKNNKNKFRLATEFVKNGYNLDLEKKKLDDFFGVMIDKSHRYGYSAEGVGDRDTLLLKAKEMYERSEGKKKKIENHMSTFNNFLSPKPKR